MNIIHFYNWKNKNKLLSTHFLKKRGCGGRGDEGVGKAAREPGLELSKDSLTPNQQTLLTRGCN